MKAKYSIISIVVFISILFVSCHKVTDVSIRMMNSKCKATIENKISLDSVVVDTALGKVDEDNLSKLLPEIEDATAWNVYFYGKRKMGRLRVFSLLLTSGENKLIKLVFVKGRTPISNIEVAANSQYEGYSYIMKANIINDSTIITRRLQALQTDEPAESVDANDSIISEYRLKPSGNIVLIKADTIPVVPQVVAVDDGEYSDEIFYYEGKNSASWAVAGITNPRAFKDFYMQFRNMVKLNDKDQIANFIAYPLGKTKDEADFVRNYDKIFIQTIREAVLGQRIRQLFHDQRGVMIGDNQLWFKQISGKYKIVTINN